MLAAAPFLSFQIELSITYWSYFDWTNVSSLSSCVDFHSHYSTVLLSCNTFQKDIYEFINTSYSEYCFKNYIICTHRQSVDVVMRSCNPDARRQNVLILSAPRWLNRPTHMMFRRRRSSNSSRSEHVLHITKACRKPNWFYSVPNKQGQQTIICIFSCSAT